LAIYWVGKGREYIG
jgi:hypothetical protein